MHTESRRKRRETVRMRTCAPGRGIGEKGCIHSQRLSLECEKFKPHIGHCPGVQKRKHEPFCLFGGPVQLTEGLCKAFTLPMKSAWTLTCAWSRVERVEKPDWNCATIWLVSHEIPGMCSSLIWVNTPTPFTSWELTWQKIKLGHVMLWWLKT